MFYQSIFDTRIGLFDSIYSFQCILNVLLECIEQFNTVQCTFIWANCSIREYRYDFSPSCWHNVLMHYYALNYAGIFAYFTTQLAKLLALNADKDASSAVISTPGNMQSRDNEEVLYGDIQCYMPEIFHWLLLSACFNQYVALLIIY